LLLYELFGRDKRCEVI